MPPSGLGAQELLTWFEPRDGQDAAYTPAEIPLAGRIMSMVLSLVTLCVLSVCICRRVQSIRRWRTIPLGAWYIMLIYADSFLFVFITAVFKDVGLNETVEICRGAILLCLTLYLSTKVCVYLFLVEKAYIVRGSQSARYKDKLYMFNICAAMGPYGVLAILNIVWRFSHVKEGVCIIGMEKKALMPLIIFDVGVNVYLTTLFIVPLRQLYSYKSNHNTLLHTMAIRAFFGSCATLTSSITNLTLLMVLDGEPAWICFLSCNAEILFSVLTLHWVTSRDRTGQTTNRSYTRSSEANPNNNHHHRNSHSNNNKSHRNSDSNPLSHSSRSRRKHRKTSQIIGTETLISEHYQDRLAGGGHSNNNNNNKAAADVSVWPEDADEENNIRHDNEQHHDGGGGGGGGERGRFKVSMDGGAGTGVGAWPEQTRAVVSASCARADDVGGGGGGGGVPGGEDIALGRIVVTREAEVTSLSWAELEAQEEGEEEADEEQQQEEEEEERRRARGGRASAAAGGGTMMGARASVASLTGGAGAGGGRESLRYGSRTSCAASVAAVAVSVSVPQQILAGVTMRDGGLDTDESDASTAGGYEGPGSSAREGSTDGIIVPAAPGAVHMV